MIRKLLPHLRQDRLAGGALVLALTQFAASAAGFFRDQAFSVMFPLDADPLGVASIYIASFRLSDLMFQMFVMSSLSVVLVPFLSSHLARESRGEMNAIVNSIVFLLGIGFGVLSLVIAAAFPLIAPSLVSFQGEAMDLYVTFGRLALLTNFLFVFGNTLGQYLIAVQKYWIYGITPVLWSLGTIGGLYFLTPYIGPLGPMIGTLVGTGIYVLCRFIGVMNAGYRLSFPRPVIHPELLTMGWLMIPRMAALGLVQLQLLMFDRLGSTLGTNAVAINAFARNFQSVIVGVAGIALAQSAFSAMSQAAALHRHDRFRMYLTKGTIMNLLLTIPAAIGLAVLAWIPAMLLRLDTPVREMFMMALAIYCISIPFESLNHLFLRAFYAMKNTMVPAAISTISVCLAIAAAYAMRNVEGLYALPIGFTVGQIAQLAALVLALLYLDRRRRSAPSSGDISASGDPISETVSR